MAFTALPGTLKMRGPNGEWVPGCWKWTGTIADGTLSGTPSLFSPTDLGGCGWHGYLTAGEMVSV